MQEQLQQAMPRAYVAAIRWLGNPDESRDACQDAAVKAWAARASYDPSRPFYPWFYRIVQRVCFDRLRLRPRQTQLAGEVTDSAGSAEVGLIQDERQRAVHRAVAALPEAQREIIELRHFQDLAYDEIALILGCPIGTVMSRLYRARKALTVALKRDPATRDAGGVR